MTKNKFHFPLLALALSFVALGATLFLPAKKLSNADRSPNQKLAQSSESNNPQVLGRNTQAPRIYIYGVGEQTYSGGGVISLASTDEPSVLIGGTSGTAEIDIYQATDDTLLNFLLHDKEMKQTGERPNPNTLQFVTSIRQDITSDYPGTRTLLPIGDKGIWYLKVKVGDNIQVDAFVIRSGIGVLTEEGDNEFIFWGQNFKTRRSVTDGVIKLYNLQDGKKEIQTVSFNAEGIAKATLTSGADIAWVIQNDDRALVPLNLKYLNYGFSYKPFQAKSRVTRYFIFTDRPLYRPGDTVYFKSVLRDDDDARYTLPKGPVRVRIFEGYWYEGSELQPIYDRNLPISTDGTINGEFKLPENAKVGTYVLVVGIPGQQTIAYWNEWFSNSTSFDVQFFKKPEYSIDITTPKRELIAGDDTSFTITGTYFSGQPLAGQSVKYSVRAADFYEYSYLSDQQALYADLSDDYRYGLWYGPHTVVEGTAILNSRGEATIDLPTKMDFNEGKSQIFGIEATLEDRSIAPAMARKNLLILAGDYGIYRKDYSYGAKINTPVSLPAVLIPYRGNGKVGGVSLTAKIHRENWVSYQEENKKYLSYRKEESDLSSISVRTDAKGNATINFTPKEIGLYTITVEGKDSRDNTISKKFFAYVTATDQPFYTSDGSTDLTVATDKQRYQPTDTVKFEINSTIPDRDVFLSLERGRVSRFQIVRLNGKSASVEVPLVVTDIPNIYAKVASFSTYALDSTSVNLPVSPDSKKLLVKITLNSQTFGPGETVNVNLETTDIAGNPASAEVALWAVDKAIFELSESNLGDIFKTFWSERYDTTVEAHSLEGIQVLTAEGGGCFGKGTKILMADGTTKNIEDLKVGDSVLTRTERDTKLVKAKVTDTHKAQESGYLIFNGNLKVTANHILRVNDTWREAGSVQPGDTFIDAKGKPVAVETIEWQQAKLTVYNLGVEKYHTYFANGVWVHNQKGAPRATFKDTAYWNPTIKTDGSGHGEVSFKLPDNLTTWTLAAVGATSDTRVGQTTSEIVVTKDVIVRPILPNILREGDEIVLSALVQNFTPTDQTFDIDLVFPAGNVDHPFRKNISIKSNQMEQFFWPVKPTKENTKAKLTFSAKSKTNKDAQDIITQEIPVRAFGFSEKRAETGDGDKNFSLKLAPDSSKEKSSVTLALSPTILGTLPSAMKYLIDYPYGCVEQTTSRFVPAVIAKRNPDLFGEALADKDINDIIEKGIARLVILQQSDGGWSWWIYGRSDPFITSYVVEYLLEARAAGAKIRDNLLADARRFLEQESYYDYKAQVAVPYTKEDQIAKNYGLTLLGSKDKVKKFNDLSGLSSDLLALAVMANYRNGDANPDTNGLTLLLSQAKSQGDALYWDGGARLNFGSRDASTALAIRALTLTGNRDAAVKGARYLTRTRRNQYWSNSFATAQVVAAITEFSKSGEELTPSYAYTVTLDGTVIAKGNVTNSRQVIKDITIPVTKLKDVGSQVEIKKTGDGQLYSTLLINEFHTDKNAPAVSRDLTVSREYINEKGNEYSIGVGDIVNVNITVSGLTAEENYGVIADELPAGLVPINPGFRGEQYGYNPVDYYSYDVTDREITENGMVLSLYQVPTGTKTYSYRARAISAGTFAVPPATASLMYAPEISGRSGAETLIVKPESELIPGASVSGVKPQDQLPTLLFVAATLLLIAIGVGLLFHKKGWIKLGREKTPPPPPTLTP